MNAERRPVTILINHAVIPTLQTGVPFTQRVMVTAVRMELSNHVNRNAEDQDAAARGGVQEEEPVLDAPPMAAVCPSPFLIVTVQRMKVLLVVTVHIFGTLLLVY